MNNLTISLELSLALDLEVVSHQRACCPPSPEPACNARPGFTTPGSVFIDFFPLWTTLWLPAVSIVSLCTNVFSMRTVLGMGLHDIDTITYFAWAVCDLLALFAPLMSLMVFPSWRLEAKFTFLLRVNPLALYAYPLLLSMAVHNFSISLMTFMTVQRCLRIAKPFRVKTMMILPAILTSCFVVAMGLSFLAVLTFYIVFKTCFTVQVDAFNRSQVVLYSAPRCMCHMEAEKNASTFLTVFNLVTSEIVLIICVVAMGKAVRDSVLSEKDVVPPYKEMKMTKDVESGVDGVDLNDIKERKSARHIPVRLTNERMDTDKQRSKECAAKAQVLVLCLIYCITAVPKCVVGLCPVLFPGARCTLDPKLFYIAAMLVCYVNGTLVFVNSSLTFLVYYKYNSRFRKYCFHQKGKQLLRFSRNSI